MQATRRDGGDAAPQSAVIGRGSSFDGTLRLEGVVRIDGTFTGQIAAQDTLIVGEGAKITANISCRSVIVSGEIRGDIDAHESVELRASARVKGDITTPSLAMEKGAIFEGRSMMEDAARARDLRVAPRRPEVAAR